MEHRSSNLKISGEGSPEVAKLQNGRYRLEFRLTGFSRTDWYAEYSEGRIFADFGSLMDAEMLVDGIGGSTAIPESVYPDMRLRENRLEYTPSGNLIVYFMYETLTDTFVQVKDDDTDYELNGLRRVTRSSIAKAGTSYEGVVGTTEISHSVAGGATITLTLARFGIDDDDAARTVQEEWLEAGTLSVSTRLMNEGIMQKTYTYLIEEGTPVGDVISRSTGNFEGLQTIEISVMTGIDGTLLTDGGAAKLNYEYQQIVPFTIPGVVDLIMQGTHIFPSVRSPVDTKVKADVLTYYQSSSEIVPSDYVLDGATSFWNPKDWCQKITTIGSFVSDTGVVQPAYYNAQGIRGCRTRVSVTVNGDSGVVLRHWSGNLTPATLNLEETVDTENGKSVYRDILDYYYDSINTFWTRPSVDISAGPYTVSGTYTVEMKWTGSQWQLSYKDLISDPVRTDSDSGDGKYSFSQRAGGVWLDTYVNQSSYTTGILLTGSGGGGSPYDATWDSITVEQSSNKESRAAVSLPANIGFGIAAQGFWLEGRSVDNGAVGLIKISGGPENPIGGRYTIDVSIKKAFDDIDGNTTWMKQVVVADITPVE